MAMRRATHRYRDLASFMRDHDAQLKDGFFVLPADAITDELANPLKLDLMLPLVGRVGPLTAQVVNRLPDGGAALRLPDFDEVAGKSVRRLMKQVETVRRYLVDEGLLVAPDAAAPAPAPDLRDELDALRARVAELEAEREAARSAAETPDDAPPAEAPALDEGGDDVAAEEAAEPPAAAPAPEAAPAEPPPAPARSRGFPVPDVSGIAPLIETELHPKSIRDALVTLAAGRHTGVLTMRTSEGRVRTGYWSKGGPVGWRSDPVQEAEVLGVLLLKAGQITRAQLDESKRIMEAKGVRQGEAFIEMGLMSFSQLIMVLGKQNDFVLQLAMRENGGTLSFHELAELPENFLPPPLPVSSLLFRTLMNHAREMRGEQLAAFLRPHFDSYAALDPANAALLNDIRLSPQEKRLVEVFQNMNLRVREVFTVSPISRQATGGFLYAFISLGLLSFKLAETREAYLERVSEAIRKKRRRLMKSTHFDTLEVHWISLPEEIRRAFHKLMAEYDPDAYRDLPAEMIEDLRYIRERLVQSHEVLENERGRREYRKTILEEFMIEQSAELLSKKGAMALMRQDARLAVDCFAKACELAPKQPEYRAQLQRAQAM